MSERTDILREAEEILDGRADTHGEPEDNFDAIAQMWSAYLGVEVAAHEVADLMALLKLARAGSNHDGDNRRDLAGYASLGEHLEQRGGA